MKWHWLVIALLLGLTVGLLVDEIAGLVVALIGGSASAVRAPRRDEGDDELDEPDTTLEQITDEVRDEWTTADSVDLDAPVGPGGVDNVAGDVEWADAARDER